MSSRLVLAGPPGVGKSTVATLCAARLGWRRVDTDEELARRLGLPVPEIFARYGESRFRAEEAALCQELAGESAVVVATGGGTLLHEPSRQSLLTSPAVGVCLTADLGTLLLRLGPDAARSRPLLQPAADAGVDGLRLRLRELLHQRAAAYRALPYHLDTTAASPETVAAQACGLAAAEVEHLRVTHPAGGYDLRIGSGLLSYVGSALAGRGYTGPLCIVSDTNVGPLYAERVRASLQAAGQSCFTAFIPAGEPNKNLRTLEQIYNALTQGGVERGGAVLALGGGVVGDLAGLAAATYLRGIGLIQVPTSLLAMADSSIGGKVGLDLAAGKNLVGAFKHPDLVLMDLACLHTLPEAELRAGLGEVVKAALIAGGPAYERLTALPQRFPPCAPLVLRRDAATDAKLPADRAALTELLSPLRDALRLKRALVEEDPEEHGRRVLLNLGHTFAHGLEPWSGYALRHGDAVALGLLSAARLSARLGLCAAEFPEELRRLMHRLGLPTTLPIRSGAAAAGEASKESVSTESTDDEITEEIGPKDSAVKAIWAFMQHDKKRHARKTRFVLIRAPGEIVTCDSVEDDKAQDAVRTLFREPAPEKDIG